MIDFVRLSVAQLVSQSSQTVSLSGVLRHSKIVSNYRPKRIVINLTGLESKDHKGKYTIECVRYQEKLIRYANLDNLWDFDLKCVTSLLVYLNVRVHTTGE